jgi:hypothetical protein
MANKDWMSHASGGCLGVVFLAIVAVGLIGILI